jgi:hypothetical protein
MRWLTALAGAAFINPQNAWEGRAWTEYLNNNATNSA